MENKKEYIILDWAGNHCFKEMTWKDPQQAWDFLHEKFPDETEYQVKEEINTYEETSIEDDLKDRKEHEFLKWLFKMEEVQNA